MSTKLETQKIKNKTSTFKTFFHGDAIFRKIGQILVLADLDTQKIQILKNRQKICDFSK